jgi:hypothetical protein
VKRGVVLSSTSDDLGGGGAAGSGGPAGAGEAGSDKTFGSQETPQSRAESGEKGNFREGSTETCDDIAVVNAESL